MLAPMLALVLLGLGCKKPVANANVMQAMRAAMTEVHSAAFALAVSGSSEEAAVPGVDTFELGLTGSIRRGEAQVANATGTFSIKTDGEEKMEAAGEYRLVNNVSFARLTTVPAIPGFDLSQFKNTWYSFPTSTDRMMEKTEKGKDLSKQQIDALEKLVRDTEFFSSVEAVGNEELRGVATTKYRVLLDEDAVVRFMEESGRIMEEPVTEEDREEARKGVREWNANPGTLWIGDTDSYLYRLAGSMEKGTVQIDLYDFNKAGAAVEVPAGAKDFGEAMGAMFGFDLGSMMPASGDVGQGGAAMDFGNIPGLTPDMLQQMEEAQKMMGR